jgi:hypothetical protein
MVMRNLFGIGGLTLVAAACGGSDYSEPMQPGAGSGDASASAGGAAGATGVGGTTGGGGTAGGGATGVGGSVPADGAAGGAPDTGCSGDACVPYPVTDASSLVGSGGQLFLFGSDIYFALGSGSGTGQVGKVAKGGGAIT